MTAPNPSGLCMCGCGTRTKAAAKTNERDGTVAGEPRRYVKGHHMRTFFGPEYVEEDRGFDSPCWVWQHARNTDGYGVARYYGSRSRIAHRNIYEQHRGAVPEGLELDHLCRTRACVNPSHLEPVTHLENIRRGSAVKLTPEMRAAVKAARGTYGEIGEKFGLSLASVWRAKHDRYDRRAAA